MKIIYQKWTCAGCNKVELIPDRETYLFAAPYWFNIRTEGCVSTNTCPTVNTFACSPECIKNVAECIQNKTEGYSNHLPKRKDIHATICDQCGKVVIDHLLNPKSGGRNQLEGWSSKKTNDGRFDFCCVECEKDNILKPKDAIFFEFEIRSSFDVYPILKALDSPDFREAFKARNNSPV